MLMVKLFLDLFSSFSFVVVFISWFLAQSIKLVLYRFTEKKWDLWHFFEAGGMPSAHSAAVTALTIGVAFELGTKTPLFTACLVFALIVMYDATGVRRAAGKQAEILNKIVDDIYSTGKVRIEKLKEILGHDPVEVLAGAILAILVTHIAYTAYYVNIIR